MTSPQPLIIERRGAVETIVLNDAPRNRMSLEFMDALEVEIGRIANEASVRAVVIRGAGEEHFSVGMDLKQLPEGIRRMGSVEAVFDQRGELESLPGDLAFYFYSPEWGQLSDSFSLWGW